MSGWVAFCCSMIEKKFWLCVVIVGAGPRACPPPGNHRGLPLQSVASSRELYAFVFFALYRFLSAKKSITNVRVRKRAE